MLLFTIFSEDLHATLIMILCLSAADNVELH